MVTTTTMTMTTTTTTTMMMIAMMMMTLSSSGADIAYLLWAGTRHEGLLRERDLLAHYHRQWTAVIGPEAGYSLEELVEDYEVGHAADKIDKHTILTHTGGMSFTGLQTSGLTPVKNT
jgi:hypothetical protein